MTARGYESSAGDRTWHGEAIILLREPNEQTREQSRLSLREEGSEINPLPSSAH